MSPHTLEADYVIVGAGAVGLAFADTLLTDTEATMIIVDRRARPGGHWVDAYPFVRLHGPSATYGVESMPLGQGRIDELGLNRGLNELAGGAEICAYFERLLLERLLPSGRVRHLPLHDLGPDNVATSLVNGQRTRLVARRRWVDATRADTQVPATHGPTFEVAEGMRCITPTELVRQHDAAAGHVIVGGGKTAMDTALWLLQQGTDPERITWIRPRESWLLNRANVQPTLPFAERTLQAMAAELESARDARSIGDLFTRLEARGLLQRIDRRVQPTMYRCAIVSEAELAELRRIRRVVRLGRVRAIERERIVLDRGEIATSPAQLHLHCSTAGLPRGPVQPVFQGRWILPQYVRRCSPTFSAAFIAHVEASFDDDSEKNALCEPVQVPEVPLDWLRMQLQTSRNQLRWGRHPQLQAWLRGSRLEAYSRLFEQAGREPTPGWIDAQRRLRDARPAALQRLQQLLDEARACEDMNRARAGVAKGRGQGAARSPCPVTLGKRRNAAHGPWVPRPGG